MEFAEFLAPFDAGTFRSQYYGQRPLHIQERRGRGPLAVAALQRSARAHAVLERGVAEGLLQEPRGAPGELLRHGGPPSRDARARESRQAEGADRAWREPVANHLHRVCPEVGAVAALLEREFAARASANVYCSFKGVQAFQTHFDLHDVFAVQAEGEKTWRIYESRADTPVTRCRRATRSRSG